jgi:DNA-directed RNA polymerase sigma subunit (sigma70/sigma32)
MMSRQQNRRHRIGGALASQLHPVRTLAAVGQILGMKSQHVEQIQNMALWKLSMAFKKETQELKQG